MTEKVKIGIIGCGAIGNTHADSISVADNCVVTAAADIDGDAVKSLAGKHGITSTYTDYRELLRSPDVDAVTVGVPNNLHASISKDSLAAGKHVFCEKPIATSYADAADMAEAARAAGKHLVIGVVNRYADSINQIKRIIDSGELGEIYQVNIKFKSYRSIPGLGGWFTSKSEAGGGVMIDWGVHFIDLVLYILGAPDILAVSGQGAGILARDLESYKFLSMWAGPPNYSGVCDVEEYASGIIRTSGPFINFEGAWACNINETAMYVDFLGSKSGIRLDYGAGFTIYGQTEDFLNETKPIKNDSDFFVNEFIGFADSIINETPSRADIEAVLPSQMVLEMFYASSEDGREIRADEIK
ncbi:MAG: Gfo/Idh/MocA family oxidoreductase [Spirochaetales bacterium]|jgi:predicted dehydrogenase|nr:Gfo/Idh/MocA family oxidoreductase [Spirochaetales bacterium]